MCPLANLNKIMSTTAVHSHMCISDVCKFAEPEK